MAGRFSGLWRDRDFLRFWAAQSISLVGSGFGALPFTAILALQAGPLEMAVLLVAQLAPGLVLGLPAGLWADRVRRRPILILADAGRAAMLGSILVAWWLDALHIEHLYVVAFVNGALTTLFDVAYQAYVPALVERDALVDANSKLAASASVAELGAFSLGGVVVQVAGAIWAVGADALSFAASALCVLGIRRPEPATAPVVERAGALREITDGLRAISHDPLQRALAVAAASRDLTYGMVGAVILLFGTRTLDLGPGVLGVIFGVGGATSLLGSLGAQRLSRRLGVGPAMAAAALIAGFGGFLVAAAAGGPWIAALFLVASQVVVDPASTIADVGETSIRQGATEERLRGRVTAGVHTLGLAVQLLGAVIAGIIGEALGLRAAIAVGMLPRVVGALWLLRSPVMRVRRIEEIPA